MILTGSLHPSNKDAIDWNERGLIVFACHNTLVFADAFRLEVFQGYEAHSSPVGLVRWRPAPCLLAQKELFDNELGCCSADSGGTVAVWEVMSGQKLVSLPSQNAAVSDIRWRDATILIVLYSNSTLTMWDGASGEKLWEKRWTTHVISKFVLDPFKRSGMALAFTTGACVMLVDDLTTKMAPLANPSVLQLRRGGKPQKTNNNLVQLSYHRAYPGLLFVLFPNEVLCAEVESLQVIFTAMIETSSPLCQLLPCSGIDAFWLIHQNGFISFRVAKLSHCEERMECKLDYERACFNEAQRSSSKLRVMGSSLCPGTQTLMALLLNSGRVVFYQLASEQQSSAITPYRVNSIAQYVRLTPSDLSNVYAHLRISQYGSLPSLSSPVTAVRVRPESRQEAAVGASPLNGLMLAAVASSAGTVHIVDLLEEKVVRELQIHSSQIKCLEWGGYNVLITAAYSASLSASLNVRNDVYATDIGTGAKRRIREELEESPVELLRVSYYHCYLAISFRSDPLEIWDLKSFRILRRMSRRCPVIVDMAWSGKHHNVKTVSDRNIYRENLVVLDNDNHLYHVVVKGLHVKDGKEVSTQWKSGATLLRCMVWKEDILAFGDSAGRLGVWDLTRSQCRQTGMTQSTRGPLLRCIFSQLAGDFTLAVQHPTSVVLWDSAKLQPIMHYQHHGLNVLDLDMYGATPVYLTSDGMFHCVPAVTPRVVAEAHAPLVMRRDIVKHLLKLATDSNLALPAVGDRCSALERENLFAYVKALGSMTTNAARYSFACGHMGMLSMQQLAELAAGVNNGDSEGSKGSHLSASLFPYWKAPLYRRRMEQLAKILFATVDTESQLELAIEKSIILRKNELATFTLLNMDQQQSAAIFRLNAYRACLLSSDLASEEARCLVKLTATNLIASNFTSDGIQLLFLIDQGLDACKYLISQGQWDKALAYSKMNPNCDYEEILTKYLANLKEEEDIYSREYGVQLLLGANRVTEFLSAIEEVDNKELIKLCKMITA